MGTIGAVTAIGRLASARPRYAQAAVAGGEMAETISPLTVQQVVAQLVVLLDVPGQWPYIR